MDGAISISELKDRLSYDAETGFFYWVKPTHGAVSPGKKAGSRHYSGYIKLMVNGKLYQGHRLAWFYTHGTWPNHQIDHINGVRDDNRLCNLREATRSENLQNKKKYRNNSSGLVGVSWHKITGKFSAYIRVNNRQIHLGLYDTPEEAHSRYAQAKEKHHVFQPIVPTRAYA